MKNILTKLLLIIFIIIFLTIIFINPVRAFDKNEVLRKEDTFEQLENAPENNIIYKFDKKTNKTTIVDVDEILALYNLSRTNESMGFMPQNQQKSIWTDNKFTRDTPNWFFSPQLGLRPYSDTCKIIAEGGLQHGSGFLVGSNLLLTNAHCVFEDKNFENYYSNWICYPAYDNGPYASGLYTGWSTVYYSSGYSSNIESVSNENDWAICVLQSNLGDTQGWFSCSSYGSSSYLEDKPIKQIGYPKNDGFSGKYQYYSTGDITNVRSKSFDTNAISHSGMSGGPIVLQSNENSAVGLIKGNYSDNTTYGVRITSEIVNLIISLQQSN